jgi:hypothetical protein
VTIGNEETVHDLFSVRNMFFVMLMVMASFRAWWPVLKIELAPFGGAVAALIAAEPAIPPGPESSAALYPRPTSLAGLAGTQR